MDKLRRDTNFLTWHRIRMTENIFVVAPYLNAEWLLTAAHCIHEAQRYPIENLLIVAGITKLYENSSHSQSSLIFRQHMHPGWGGGIGPDDIGLIRIKTPFKWTSDVSWIALPFANREYEGVIVIAGWGYRRSSYPVPSVALQYARGGTISTNQCNRIINPYAIRVDDRSVCTLGYDLGSETSCEGDSGGPVVYPDYPNKPIQIGVMSWNLSPCGIKHTPSVSTKVSKYIGWIKCRVEMDYVAPTAPCN
ncbi:hypothetical protein RI129_007753 [Pyrocoelia pectoralis]|uniref:Peptidase S1 domain-containing protein n=1 Tax=Pyrocoelia pectoralis TaxID=417401 RepID=A0AAN7VEQ1_9COLE